MAYHDKSHILAAAEWSRRDGVIAMGHGTTGDLRKCQFRNADDIRRLVAATDSRRTPGGCSNDGRSMWRLFSEMKVGDLVILNAPGPFCTIRVTGDYFFVAGEFPPKYEHRRKAQEVPINPTALWRLAGGAAPGQGVYAALIKCARELTEAEYYSLTGATCI